MTSTSKPILLIARDDIEESQGDGRTIRKIDNRLLKIQPIVNIASNIARRATSNGLSDKLKATFSVEKQHTELRRKSEPFLAGLAYCISSCSMILLNKVVLSGYNFNAGISLMLYQNFISVVILLVLKLLGVLSPEKLTWKLIQIWMPENVIFVGMLVTGMYSLKHINVAMVTILKNMTNIMTAIGETYLFRKHHNQKVVSAISGGFTDLSFDAIGYIWQTINCILSASYSLTLRHIMDTAKQSTTSGSLREVTMVLLNNSLSLPLAFILILLFHEWESVYNADAVKMPIFWVVATMSGVLGLAISFTSMWFLNKTGPTTYRPQVIDVTPNHGWGKGSCDGDTDGKLCFILVGSLNKIPISIAGILLFNVPLSTPNLFSILFGLSAGVFFARAKMS